MPESSKKKDKENSDPIKSAACGTASDDQKSRPYYYDDACGYEEYVPDDQDKDDGNEESSN